MYQTSLTAKKLMSSIISIIEPNDPDFEYYMIPVEDWKRLSGCKGNGYFEILIKAAKELRSKSITIKKGDEIINLGLVTAVKKSKKKNMVGVRFDKELKPFLLNLKGNMLLYRLGDIMKMRSIYSIRLFELLKSKQDKLKNKSSKIVIFEEPLSSLRLKLGLEDKLKPFGSFKDRVLEIAKKEIPEKTGIRFSYKPIKKGRSVYSISFEVSETLKADDIENVLKDCLKRLPSNLSNNQVSSCKTLFKRILKESDDVNHLKWIISYVNRKKHDNYGGYVQFVYSNKLYEKYLEEKKLEDSFLAKEEAIARVKKQEELKKDQTDNNAMEREAYLNELIANLSPEDEDELNQLALKRLESDAETKTGSKQTLDRYLKYFNGNKKERAIKCLYQYRLKLIEDFKAEKGVELPA